MNFFKFLMFWKDNTIENRVMKVVKARITTAQEKYEAKCAELDEDCKAQIEKIEAKRNTDKVLHAEELVQEILAR